MPPNGGIDRHGDARSCVLPLKLPNLENIDSHIAKLTAELQQAKQSGESAKVNHLENELKDLEAYKAHHPGEQKDPSPLEVYCDLNPEAPECLVYDD